jgi:hypothetical protein
MSKKRLFFRLERKNRGYKIFSKLKPEQIIEVEKKRLTNYLKRVGQI